MKLDVVHDIQKAYRKMINSLSRPGVITDLKDEAGKVDIVTGCLNTTAVFVLMLFDTEVNFKTYSRNKAEVTKVINQLTYAKAVETPQANFILVLLDAEKRDFSEALTEAYPGNLLNPHQSATLIIEVKSLSNDQVLTLTGPGIENKNYICVKTSPDWDGVDWVRIRAEKNIEYPLGIDLIFVDQNHNVLCLPRTTKISRQVVS